MDDTTHPLWGLEAAPSDKDSEVEEGAGAGLPSQTA